MSNLELPLSRSPSMNSVPLGVVRAQKTSGAAISLACHASGLEDKEIYLSLGIDAGHFSRIKKGEAGFPADKLRDFCNLIGNTIYPEWLAYQVGCQLVMVKTEAERRADEAEARAKNAEAQVAMLKQLLIGRAE